jgi:hypothetical protein
MRPEDLERSAAFVQATFDPAAAADWSVPAGDLTWTCRRTLDHIVDCHFFYAQHLALRSAERLPSIRDGDASVGVDGALASVRGGAAILAAVASAAPPEVRAYHPAGKADPEGFVAMGADETLVHAWDIARGLGLAFDPPPELAAPVLARLFPWAPADTHPWPALLWCNGRIALGDRPRQDRDWYWHCAPLDEWTGEVGRRTQPPGWI